MPQPQLSEDICIETLNAVQRNNGNITQAARELGVNRSTFEARVRSARTRGYEATELPPVEQPPERQRNAKPRVRVRALTNESPPEGLITRVLAIGDSHDSPDIPDKSRFKWIGRHINEWSPDAVVDIGDSVTLDSLCSYVGNETYHGKLKPSFQADLESYNKACEAQWNECPNWKGKRYKTRGNHEDRLYSFENRHPEVWGMMQGEYRRIIESYGIDERDYGKFLFINGVGFIHTPMTMMGKPYGGKTMQPIANDATFDIVFGHTHKQGVLRVPKIGPQNYIKIVNLGSAMPWGHVEDYAKLATTGWWWGVVELLIQGGHVVSENFIPMTELERRYGS